MMVGDSLVSALDIASYCVYHVGKGEGNIRCRKDTHLSPLSMGSPKVIPRCSYIS